MAVRIVRLGSPRHPDEGLRIGTVRRPRQVTNARGSRSCGVIGRRGRPRRIERCSIHSQRCQSTRISRSGATAPRRRIVTARCCGRCSRSEVPDWGRRLGRLLRGRHPCAINWSSCRPSAPAWQPTCGGSGSGRSRTSHAGTLNGCMHGFANSPVRGRTPVCSTRSVARSMRPAHQGRSRNCSIGGLGRAGRSRERERAARIYSAQSPMRRARSTSCVLLPSTIESTVIV